MPTPTVAPQATLLPTAVCPLPTPVVASERVPPLESGPRPLAAFSNPGTLSRDVSTLSTITRGALDGGGAGPSDMAHLNILRSRCYPKVQIVAGKPSGSAK